MNTRENDKLRALAWEIVGPVVVMSTGPANEFRRQQAGIAKQAEFERVLKILRSSAPSRPSPVPVAWIRLGNEMYRERVFLSLAEAEESARNTRSTIRPLTYAPEEKP